MTSSPESTYQLWKPLKAGDIVDIIAPAAACPRNSDPVQAVKEALTAWGLIPRIPDDIFGEDLLCANSDEKRFAFIQQALQNTESSAIWCLRGGYGCTRLLPALAKLPQPKCCKLFIGLSDITALHIFLQQRWHWATLHGSSAREIALANVEQENIDEMKKIIFGEQTLSEFNLTPLNKFATQKQTLTAPITGGNLCLVQTSLGTFWQIDTAKKILFLEEVNERGYRIDRMLQHLKQAGVFEEISAVIFGDFIGGNEPNGQSLVEPVLKRFAEECEFPVLSCPGIGHGKFNRPLPLGIPAQLTIGETSTLTIKMDQP